MGCLQGDLGAQRQAAEKPRVSAPMKEHRGALPAALGGVSYPALCHRPPSRFGQWEVLVGLEAGGRERWVFLPSSQAPSTGI